MRLQIGQSNKLKLPTTNSGSKNFEDGLQNFAAMKNGEIDVILTRNLKDFNKSEIGVLTPESYVKSIIANR